MFFLFILARAHSRAPARDVLGVLAKKQAPCKRLAEGFRISCIDTGYLNLNFLIARSRRALSFSDSTVAFPVLIVTFRLA